MDASEYLSRKENQILEEANAELRKRLRELREDHAVRGMLHSGAHFAAARDLVLATARQFGEKLVVLHAEVNAPADRPAETGRRIGDFAVLFANGHFRAYTEPRNPFGVSPQTVADLKSRLHRLGQQIQEDWDLAVYERKTSGCNQVEVLYVAANTDRQSILRLDTEYQNIREEVERVRAHNRIEVVNEFSVNVNNLLRVLNRHRPEVLHFSGHGNPDSLVMWGTGSVPHPIGDAAARAVLASAGTSLRLLFLNCCNSSSIAQGVVDAVEAAIGMSGEISDDAACVFAAAFYGAIASGLSVGTAFAQGQAALRIEARGEENIPALFTKQGVNASALYLIVTNTSSGGVL